MNNLYRFTFVASLAVLAACPVEHATDDSGFTPVHHDAGDSDALVLDAAAPDLVGQDLTGRDTATPDTRRDDAAVVQDAARVDGAGVDGAAVDGAVVDGGGVDSSSGTDGSMSDTASSADATAGDAGTAQDVDAIRDAAGVDATSGTCTSDDSFEENDDVSHAPALDISLEYNLTGCDDDWFSFTVPANQGLVIDILFTDAVADLDLALYRADNITRSLDTSMSTSDNEQVNLAPQAAETALLLRVDHYSGGSAPYTLRFTTYPPPDNDSCEQAQVVTVPANGSQVSVTGSTLAAGDSRESTMSSCHNPSTGSITRDVFYQFTMGAGLTGHVFAELITDGWYGVVYAFEGDCNASADLDCSSSRAVFPVTGGHTYYVAVDGEVTGDEGTFELRLHYRPIPVNDTCAGAETFVLPTDGSVVQVSGDTAEGTHTLDAQSSSSYCQATVTYAPELFYAFTAASTGTVHLELDMDWRASIYVQDGACGASPAEHMCWGMYSTSRVPPLWYRFEVQQGASYTVVVDGYADVCCSDSQGPFTLSARYVFAPPALQGGETCLDAVALTGASGSLRGDTSGAVHDVSAIDVGCYNSSSGGDLFYRLTVPAGRTATLRVEHSEPYFPLLAYVLNSNCPVRGDSCMFVGGDELELKLGSGPSWGELAWTNSSTASVDYFVVIDATSFGYGETFDLSWDITP